MTGTDIIAPRESADDREERRARDSVMARLERDIGAMLDEMLDQFRAEALGEEPREYLDALRVLLKSQVTAYTSFLTSRRDALFTTTSPMYAGELSPAGPVPTTLHGLIEGGTMTPAQAARLASYVSDRRTLLIFGDRATGKSTLLNALLELVPVDERLVSIEHSDHLPALDERSFCVRLSIDDRTDIESVFAKAMKMQPSRIVVGEVHAGEILYFGAHRAPGGRQASAPDGAACRGARRAAPRGRDPADPRAHAQRRTRRVAAGGHLGRRGTRLRRRDPAARRAGRAERRSVERAGVGDGPPVQAAPSSRRRRRPRNGCDTVTRSPVGESSPSRRRPTILETGAAHWYHAGVAPPWGGVFHPCSSSKAGAA
jgi:energy-coupling factor transporter ATP-binding protein EcfA2